MPATDRSIELTDRYRDQLRRERLATVSALRSSFASIDGEDLDRSYESWRSAAVAITEASQRASEAITSSYVAAYIHSEAGHRSTVLRHAAELIGVDRFGRPLARAFTPPLATVKMAIGSGVALDLALAYGLQRALRIGSDSVGAAGKALLHHQLVHQKLVTGWRRVTRGKPCGACLAAANGTVMSPDAPIEFHTNCDCVKEPVIAGVDERVTRPTGSEIFAALSRSEQDALFHGAAGKQKASLLRQGRISLDELIAREEPALGGPAVITERPLAELR